MEEEGGEQLKYRTWVLKVSIHCQGCKTKVKKVLQSIEGVYTTVVDSDQHKVTVTGNVEVEILIKKLWKSGKHAELWPENPKKGKENLNNGKNGNNERREKGVKPTDVIDKETPKQTAGDVTANVTPKNVQVPNNNQKGNGKGSPQKAEPKEEGNGTSLSPSQGKKQQQQQQHTSIPAGSDGGCKKKWKKPPNEEGPVTTTDEGTKGTPGNTLPPTTRNQHGYQQFPMYLPTPVYGMSYNMTHPTTSFGYYTSLPEPTEQSFNHFYYSGRHYPPLPYNPSPLPPAPAGVSLPQPECWSHEGQSEENRNSFCSIM